jgi:hypothetical protein
VKHLAITLTTVLLIGLWIAQTDNASTEAHRPFVITGQVLDQYGSPVSYANVSAYPDLLFGRLPSALADSSGKFSMEVENTGKYRLTAAKSAEQYAPLISAFHYPSSGAMPEAVVKAEQPAPFVIVRLGPRAGILTGSVIDATTQEYIQRFHVRICRVEGSRYCHQELFSGNLGRFQILVPATPILIEAFADGYQDWQRTDDGKQQPTPLTVTSGETVELTVQLTKLGTSTEGLPKPLAAPQPLSPANGTEFDHFPRVTKLEWSAVPGAVSYAVEIDFCDGFVRKKCSDPNKLEGRALPPTSGIEGTSYEFSFLGAQPGRWRVWALDAHGWAGTKSDWFWFVYRR